MRCIAFVPFALCMVLPCAQAAPQRASASNASVKKSTGKKPLPKATASSAAKRNAAKRATAKSTKANGKVSAKSQSDAHTGHLHAAPPKKAESKLDALWRQADEAFHKGDYEKSIAFHKQVVALDPHDAQSFGVAAWLMWSLGRGDDAIAHLRRGVKGDPKNWDMWNELALNFDLQKRWADSQDAYTHAIALLPKGEDSQMIRRRLAHAAEKAGDFPTSIATWRALAHDFPGEAINRNNLARVEASALKATQTAPGDATTTNEAAPIVLAGAGLLGALLVPALLRR